MRQIYDIAVQNSQIIKGALYNVDEYEKKVVQRKSMILPEIKGTISNTWRQAYPTSGYLEGNVALSQEFRISALRGYKAAKKAHEVERLKYHKKLEDILFNVIERYLDIVRSERQLQLWQLESEIVSKFAQISKRRFDMGSLSLPTLQNAIALEKSSQFRLIQAEGQYDQSLLNLIQLTNQQVSLDSGNTISIDIKNQLVLNTLNYWNQLAGTHNKDLIVQRGELDLQYMHYLTSQADKYPVITATVTKYLHGGALRNIRKDYTESVLSLSGSFYDGGNTDANINSALDHWHVIKSQLEEKTNTIRYRISKLYKNLSRTLLLLESQNELISVINSTLVLSMKEYDLGRQDFTAVLKANRDLFNAQRNAVDAEFQFLQDYFELKLHAGVLKPDDLDLL